MKEGEKILLKLVTDKTEDARIITRNNFIEFFKTYFWLEESHGSLLDLMNIFHKVFYLYNKDVTEHLMKSRDLYMNSAYVSTLSTLISFLTGHLDFKFLRDVYLMCYLLEMSLINNRMTYFLKVANHLDLKSPPGTPLGLGSASKWEKVTFLNHPTESAQEAKSYLGQYFVNPEILDLIERHHERLTGRGFPKKIDTATLSDMEKIIIYVHHYLQREQIKDVSAPARSYLKTLFMGGDDYVKNVDIFDKRLKKTLLESIEKIDELPEEQEKTEEKKKSA